MVLVHDRRYHSTRGRATNFHGKFTIPSREAKDEARRRLNKQKVHGGVNYRSRSPVRTGPKSTVARKLSIPSPVVSTVSTTNDPPPPKLLSEMEEGEFMREMVRRMAANPMLTATITREISGDNRKRAREEEIRKEDKELKKPKTGTKRKESELKETETEQGEKKSA